MKNLLVIAYYFPPAGGAGVQRTAKFCDYLPGFGWDPVVVTAGKNSYKMLDFSFDEKAYKVRRVKFFDYNKYMLKAKKYKMHKIFALLNVLLALPDNKIFWIFKARKEIYSIIDKGNMDAAYISCAPFSAAIIIPFIKKKYSIPVVLDYRDPWSNNKFAIYLPGYQKLNHKIEKWVLRCTDGLVAASGATLRWIEEEFGFTGPMVEITNGFDEKDLVIDEIAELDNSKFKITYIGSFYGKYNPRSIIKAIDDLISTNIIAADKIEFVLVGALDEYKGLRTYINCVGYVNHSEVKNYAYATDVLLLVVPSDEPNVYPGKLFEYLALNKPILAAAPEGIAKKVILETNTGYVCDIGRIEDIARAISELYQMWENGKIKYNPNRELIKKYSRKNLTERLSNFLNIVATGETDVK